MEKDGVVPVEMMCNSCLYCFVGYNQVCPSCGSDDIDRLPAQQVITPSVGLVLSSPHYGYGEL